MWGLAAFDLVSLVTSSGGPFLSLESAFLLVQLVTIFKLLCKSLLLISVVPEF